MIKRKYNWTIKKIAGALKLADAQVLRTLVSLLSDPCWRVKAHVLRG